MPIKFENIDNGDTFAIDPQLEGKHFGAKLSALVNSSNLSVNADRGQDFGIRLDPEQQAIIEMWEQDPQMIDKVSAHTKVPTDALSHGDFLMYMVYTQQLGTSPERREVQLRRERQAEYEKRVQLLRKAEIVEPMAPFKAPTVEDFLAGDVTGDASGDKVVEEAPAVEPVVMPDVKKKK